MPWLVGLLVNIVVGYAIGYAVNYFFGKKADPRVFSPKFDDNQAQVRSAVESHKVVYGKSLTSGPLTFAATNGPGNLYMHIVVPLTGHEVKAIDAVYFDDISSAGTEYNKIEVWDIVPSILSVHGWIGVVLINGKRFAGAGSGSSRIKLGQSMVSNLYNCITGAPGYASENYTVSVPSIHNLRITGKTTGDEVAVSLIKTTGPTYNTECGTVVYYFNDSAVGYNESNQLYLYLSSKSKIFDLYKHLGSPNQVANTALVAENVGWTSNHRLRGRSYLYAKLGFYADRWPTGIPALKAEVRGRLAYDPRTALTDWSANPAVCIRDYLTAVFGLGASSAEINDTTFIAAANICDEYVLASSPKTITTSSVANPTVLTATAHKLRTGDEVAVAGHSGSTPSINGNHTVTVLTADTVSIPVNVTVGGTGGTVQLRQKRYTCNGTIALGERPIDVIQKMLTSLDGKLVYTEGKYSLFAGAYTAPVGDFNESHLRGGLHVVAKPPRKQLFNGVRGTILDPKRFWQETDFPVYKNATYATEDGEEIISDITLPFTDDAFAAQRMAKQILERSRQSIAVVFPAKLNAFKFAVNDVVRLSISYLGWTNKEFRILTWSLTDFGVDITLQEESSASYNWNNGDETIIDAAPNSSLPNIFEVLPPTAVTLTEELYQSANTAGVRTRIKVSWTAPNDISVVGYSVTWNSFPDDSVTATFSPRSVSPQISDTVFYIDDVYPGYYTVEIKSVNSFGFKSASTVPVSITVYGLTSAPVDVTGLSIIKSSGVALAQWFLHPDMDVRVGGHVVIRHSALTSGATWNDGIILDVFDGNSVAGLVPLITGTYMAKAIDSSGNYSANATVFVATEGMVTGFTTVATSTQHTTFTGVKSSNGTSFDGVDDCVLVPDSASLQLATSLTVEAWFKTGVAGATNKGIIRKDTSTGARYLYGIFLSDGTFGPSGAVGFQFYNGANHIVNSSASVADKIEHHAVLTISGTTLTGYLDGASLGSITITGTQGLPTGELNIGANPPWVGPNARSEFFTGVIRGARIYNRAITPTEVSEHFNGKFNNETGLVGHWELNEGIGTVANDTSGTGNTGTLTNGPIWNSTLAAVGGALQLNGSTLIDSITENIDTLSYLDYLGGVVAAGSYSFSTYLDMTTVATRRFEANVSALSFDTGDSIDARLDSIDIWGVFDGNVIDDCDVTLYAATTNDNPSGSPVWGEWTPFFVSDFTCRAARFKLDFESGQTSHNIAVSVLQVEVKVPA